MYRTHWNRKRICYLAVILILLWFLFRGGYNDYEITGIIENTNPKDVWEFVADFSKMMILNPTIVSFKITDDSGNYEHWKYSVIYKERLSHWPYWENVGTADYSVRYEQAASTEIYIVASKHTTCFLAGFYCLSSEGDFRFAANGSDTFCREKVRYQCPPFFGRMCRREVEFQRNAIMENLKKHFRDKTE